MNPIECVRNNIEPVGHDGSCTLQKILRCVAISLMVAMAWRFSYSTSRSGNLCYMGTRKKWTGPLVLDWRFRMTRRLRS